MREKEEIKEEEEEKKPKWPKKVKTQRSQEVLKAEAWKRGSGRLPPNSSNSAALRHKNWKTGGSLSVFAGAPQRCCSPLKARLQGSTNPAWAWHLPYSRFQVQTEIGMQTSYMFLLVLVSTSYQLYTIGRYPSGTSNHCTAPSFCKHFPPLLPFPSIGPISSAAVL